MQSHRVADAARFSLCETCLLAYTGTCSCNRPSEATAGSDLIIMHGAFLHDNYLQYYNAVTCTKCDLYDVNAASLRVQQDLSEQPELSVAEITVLIDNWQ